MVEWNDPKRVMSVHRYGQQQRKNASDSLIACFLDNEQERTGNARQACRVEGEQCTALSSVGAQSSRAYRKRRGGTGRTTSIRTRIIGTNGPVPGHDTEGPPEAHRGRIAFSPARFGGICQRKIGNEEGREKR